MTVGEVYQTLVTTDNLLDSALKTGTDQGRISELRKQIGQLQKEMKRDRTRGPKGLTVELGN